MDREVTWTMKHPGVCVWIRFGRDTEQLILHPMLCGAYAAAALIHPEASWASANASPFITRPFRLRTAIHGLAMQLLSSMTTFYL